MASIISSVYSQLLYNTVITSSDNFSTRLWGTLSSTIGEASIVTLILSNIKLLQGFQQSTNGLFGIVLKNEVAILNIYLNPASEKLILSVTSIYKREISYKIFDTTGKEIFEGDYKPNNANFTNKNLDTSVCSSGIYLIYIYSGNNSIKRTKIQILH